MMGSESVLVGMVILTVMVGLVAGFLSYIGKTKHLFMPGIRKCLWCEKKQRLVAVDFMAVNPTPVGVASCTAFSVDECISCDKHCVSVLEKKPDSGGVKNDTGEKERRILL